MVWEEEEGRSSARSELFFAFAEWKSLNAACRIRIVVYAGETFTLLV